MSYKKCKESSPLEKFQKPPQTMMCIHNGSELVANEILDKLSKKSKN